MSELSQQHNALVRRIGELAHQRLIEHRARTQTTPYIKKTIDEAWISRNGADHVDLAQCSYEDLPADWRQERDAGAQIALDAVHSAQQNSTSLDELFIERVAAVLHDAWLERNSHRANEQQLLTYDAMSESEKEKDRIFVRAAIEVAS